MADAAPADAVSATSRARARRRAAGAGDPRLCCARPTTTEPLRSALADAGWRCSPLGAWAQPGAHEPTRSTRCSSGSTDLRGRPILRRRLEPRRRLSRASWRARCRDGEGGGDARLTLLRRSAAEQCLAALRMGRRPQGRRSAGTADHRQAAGADLAFWSRKDGLIAPRAARGLDRRARRGSRARLHATWRSAFRARGAATWCAKSTDS